MPEKSDGANVTVPRFHDGYVAEGEKQCRHLRGKGRWAQNQGTGR